MKQKLLAVESTGAVNLHSILTARARCTQISESDEVESRVLPLVPATPQPT